MSEKIVQFKYQQLEDDASLSDQERSLIKECKDFAANAYAPYSKFNVSAIAKLSNGDVIRGTNVENASYPVAICAERTLLSHVIANFPNEKIDQIYIYADADTDSAVPPCGLCRQSLVEAELRQQHPIKLYLVAKNGQIVIVNQSIDLLPFHFDGNYLKNS